MVIFINPKFNNKLLLLVTGVPRSFVLTLGIGITFGYSFAYMLINISPPNASSEYFIQPSVRGSGGRADKKDKVQLSNRSVQCSHDHIADEAGPDKEVVIHQHLGEDKGMVVLDVFHQKSSFRNLVGR